VFIKFTQHPIATTLLPSRRSQRDLAQWIYLKNTGCFKSYWNSPFGYKQINKLLLEWIHL